MGGLPSVGMMRVSCTISSWMATMPGAWKTRIPLLYITGNIEAGSPRVMQRSQVSKSVGQSNAWPRRQLDRIASDRRLPSSV